VSPETPRIRLSILGVVVVSLFAALFARLWYLQIMAAPEARVAAEANIVRQVAIQAPRGRILDRDGTVLVDNRISVIVTIERSVLDELTDRERADVLARLAQELTRAGQATTVDQLEARLADRRFSPYTPLPVAQDVPETLKIFLEERAEEFPSVGVERTAVRRYPYGQIAGHILGYVGEINDVELDERSREREKPYQLGDDIGKAGVERMYEDDLRGVPGVRTIEVDVDGDPVRIIDDEPPLPGDDVVLSIDVDVQALAEETLARGLEQARERRVRAGNEPNKGTKGAVVVEDPSTGELLAMASYPAFPDPSEFVNGISTQRWEELTRETPDNQFPLNNWAIQGQWAPGSTFKLFTGYAALQTGIRQPNTTINDPGYYDVPNCDGRCRFYNAGSTRHGSVDMRRALTISSDVFFYDIGAQFWLRRGALGSPTKLQELVRQFGLDEKTGLGLPGERAGRIPTPQQRKEFCENPKAGCIDSGWYTGDNVNIAIGQGDVLVTPLQLVNAYSAFANGGTLRSPIIAREVRKAGTAEVLRRIEGAVVRTIQMAPEHRAALLEGLMGVPTRGTAALNFQGFPHETFPLAAKTGTAEVNGKADTAVFVAYGPTPAPRFAVSVFMEESGFGGTAAAPVARRLFDVFAGVVQAPPAPTGGTYDPQVAALLEPEYNGEVTD
jgi:penicillin-binding protein 2